MGRIAWVLALAACGDDATAPHDSTLPDGSSGEICTVDGQCDDGVYCNGVERCAGGVCGAGNAVACDDGIECTTDRCDEDGARCVSVGPDADGDGAVDGACGGTDCDDADGARYPGNAETCDADAHDEDCDPATYGFRDADGDAWPDARCCNDDGAGGMSCGSDCDDTLPTAHPSEAEVCDGVDNDCDLMTDETVTRTFFGDADADGYGTDTPTMDACFAPEGFAEMAGDCDDSRGFVSPRSPEACDAERLDEDCDGESNPAELCNCSAPDSRTCLAPGVCSRGTQDCVMGMWGACSIAGSAETCDGEDDDCDGLTDETFLVRCFEDADGDTFPEAGAALVQICPDDARTFVGRCPSGYTDREPIGAMALDCQATDATIFPGATETCDAVDQDCDGGADEGLRVRCWNDGDGDGYALGSATVRELCPAPGTMSCPMGTTNREPMGTGTSDCDDANSARSPSAVETCNGTDDDCDGAVDDTLRINCYLDSDRDGYAPSGATPALSCPDPGTGACPAGRTDRAPMGTMIDCADTNAMRSPAISEACNSTDDDCDTRTDEGLLLTCYADADRDGYAPSGATGMMVCPSGGTCPAMQTSRAPSMGNIDCADTSSARSPAIAETCNGVDDDCDSNVDETLLLTCYADGDSDGYAPSGATPTMLCPSSGSCPAMRTSRAPTMGNIDCLDTSAARSPSVAETCNSVDDDCDSSTDEGLLLACYTDTDGDGYAPSGATPTMLCPSSGSCPAMRTSRAPTMGNIDCLDTSAARSPSVAETCNGVDDDCDSNVDESLLLSCYTDADGDGYAPSGATAMMLCPSGGSCPAMRTSRAPTMGNIDCLDTSATRSPAVSEACNGTDDDCDTRTDEGLLLTCFLDMDRDGYPPSGAAAMLLCPSSGSCPVMTTSLSPAVGPIDCADMNAGRSPAVSEACNSIDDDCDTRVDEFVATRCYTDADSDGYAPMGAAATDVCGACPAMRTSRPPGVGSTDCNDSSGAVSPAVPEICNMVNDDCDATTDEGFTYAARYRDVDNDGYGRAGVMMVCASAGGYADVSGDCNDDVFAVNPGQGSYFTTPICPAGHEPCFTGDSVGCQLIGGFDCMLDELYWDYDCSRRATTNAVRASCTSPGSSCTIFTGCSGVGGWVGAPGDTGPATWCGATRDVGGCGCSGTVPSMSCQAPPPTPPPFFGGVVIGCR